MYICMLYWPVASPREKAVSRPRRRALHCSPHVPGLMTPPYTCDAQHVHLPPTPPPTPPPPPPPPHHNNPLSFSRDRVVQRMFHVR
jgi:hypothetical protein